MKKTLLLMIALFLVIASTGVSSAQIAASNTNLNKDLDEYIEEIQQQYHIPGLALAVIKDGKVIHKKSYGIANIEYNIPLNDQVIFPLFSTTKVFSVVAAYQLIQQKKLSLDSKIAEFISDLPDTWKAIKIENLLTHASGLPDIVDYETEREESVAKAKVYKDAIKFQPGNQFDYNQTNFWLLNRIIQKITGKTLAQYIIENQFSSFKNAAVFEGNNLRVVKNLSYGYVYENEQTMLKRNWFFPVYMYGTAALNLSLNDFINWNKQFDDGVLIKESTKQQLLKPYHYQQERDFTYGLDLIKTDGKISYGFSGGVATAFRKFPGSKITVIFLANGMLIPTGKLRGINEVINQIEKLSSK
ncbi:serine hydrolase domain-containing protein [Pedobacter polysacchareus]|uniref:serine hydrolase domain-containing protein n=1 Tax=Pedobacter polysacchareus TaxID=2861973 RepID=UPI001C993FB2|nr:serine hydrolase domain-containing protein [Pedobacter polysacchareus]